MILTEACLVLINGIVFDVWVYLSGLYSDRWFDLKVDVISIYIYRMKYGQIDA